MKQLIEVDCGGMRDGLKVKAIIPGGSSVPLLPAADLDTALDYESMNAKGTFLGSGGVIVIDHQTCIVDALWNITRFYEHESCGKCTPCREGTYWMAEVLERLENGHGKAGGHRPLADVADNILGQELLRTRRCRRHAGAGRAQALPRRVRAPRHPQDLSRQPSASRGRGGARLSRMARVTIDGRTVEVPAGTLVTDAARAAEVHVPIFCSHQKLPPLGACRICVVEVGTPKLGPDRQPVIGADGNPEIAWMPKVQTGCTTFVSDGMHVRTATETAVKARKGVMEFLLVNHPLDCPVCDEGGECQLQDLAFAFGHDFSRMDEAKRTFDSEDLGPIVKKEANRCIVCMRCVRYCDEVMGENALTAHQRGVHTEISSFDRQPLACEQCGNCVEVCPVGALTALPYRFKARPWDLRQHITICEWCPNGCSVRLGVRGMEILRARGTEFRGVNQEYLCVRGRFGHEFVNAADRLTAPLVRTGAGTAARDVRGGGGLRLRAPARPRGDVRPRVDRVRGRREAEPRRAVPAPEAGARRDRHAQRGCPDAARGRGHRGRAAARHGWRPACAHVRGADGRAGSAGAVRGPARRSPVRTGQHRARLPPAGPARHGGAQPPREARAPALQGRLAGCQARAPSWR
jgi:ferredoxin